MISISLGDLIGAISALGTHKDKIARRLNKAEINQLRHSLSVIHFARDGSLKVLEDRGLDDYIAILQRDTAEPVGSAIQRIWELVQRVDLPIETKESLVKIRTFKNEIRAEISRSLLERDQDAVENLISEIKELNENIVVVEKYLFDLSID